MATPEDLDALQAPFLKHFPNHPRSAKPPHEKRASHVFHAIDCREIKARYRDFHLISIVVRNAEIDVPDAQALNDTIAAAEQAALRDDAQRDAHLAAWAVAYQAFGTKANRTPCSAAALLKRVRKDGSLPRISPLVDAYNAVSVLYGVPIGGEDLDLYQGSRDF
ncbi:phenylalanine--tRNA ligase beta subunit-related protein [Mesorhizobium sp. M1273]|uniref:B3/B4 domain-containing protein n=1 Tax=Mesorhizobium sp. M1273 TaxID=2957075 RepID=UPI00333510CB